MCADGYRYAGKDDRLRSRVCARCARRLPEHRARRRRAATSTEQPGPRRIPAPSRGTDSRPHRRRPTTPAFARLPFDHPLYIMYSSGTTGLPKCMVHGAGGTLLQHLKELVLHTDLDRDDRIFYFTTCGWMMWNWLVSSLAVGRHGGAVRRRAARRRAGHPVGHGVDGSGSRCSAPARNIWRWRRRRAGAGRDTGSDARSERFSRPEARSPATASTTCTGRSSPTCISRASAAAPTSSPASRWAIPIAPVWRGELQTRGLGMAVEVFDDVAAVRSRGSDGELVCTRPFPSMPVAFWDDPDGSQVPRGLFRRYPGVWRHGDWARLTEHDGLVILRPQRRDAQPGRRPDRHGGDLSPGRAAARGRGEPGGRAGLGGRRADRAVRAAARRDRRSTTRCATASGAGSASTRARTTCRARSCRWRTFRGRSAARSPSWPCGR